MVAPDKSLPHSSLRVAPIEILAYSSLCMTSFTYIITFMTAIGTITYGSPCVVPVGNLSLCYILQRTNNNSMTVQTSTNQPTIKQTANKQTYRFIQYVRGLAKRSDNTIVKRKAM